MQHRGIDDKAACAVLSIFQSQGPEFDQRLAALLVGESEDDMKVRQIIDQRCEASFEWQGEPVNLVFRPFTSAALEAAGLGTDKAVTGGVADFLARSLMDWDVEGDNGKPYPLDFDSLNALPVAFNVAAINAVVSGMTVPPTPGPASGGTS